MRDMLERNANASQHIRILFSLRGLGSKPQPGNSVASQRLFCFRLLIQEACRSCVATDFLYGKKSSSSPVLLPMLWEATYVKVCINRVFKEKYIYKLLKSDFWVLCYTFGGDGSDNSTTALLLYSTTAYW